MNRLTALLPLLLSAIAPSPAGELDWPEPSREARPWSYWWWMGSAVDEANITRELEAFQRAGWGGVHIIPIYGAKGFEARSIEYLSPRWMAMLNHTVTEARRLGLDVDMTLGAGWCFGGPNIGPEHANTLAVPKLTPDGWQVGVRQTMRVKRAAPGGEGFMLDPFSRDAITRYLDRFTAAFNSYGGALPRAIYHDSFEYQANWTPRLLAEFERRRLYRLQENYDALFGGARDERAMRVKADYRETLSDLLVEDFTSVWTGWARNRKLLTRNQAHGSPGNLLDLYALADIPETEMFRNDRSTLVAKLASSAAHLTGRKLVASETGTWLKEHFHVTLGDMKELIQQLFVAGVNHVVYHGSAYSPAEAPWPGWVFYASTQMNSRNPIWRDVPALNAWITRSQTVLQQGASDNDVLLYWPVHDVWHNPEGLHQNFTVHSRAWFTDQPFGQFAQRLYDRGWSFDFVSERLLRLVANDGDGLWTPGARYRAIVVPPLRYMPLEALLTVMARASAGATVIFAGSLPTDVPGWGRLEEKRRALELQLSRLNFGAPDANGVRVAKLQQGRVLAGPVEAALEAAGIRRETLVDRKGLEFIRRIDGAARHYFVVNRGEHRMEGWISLAHRAAAVALMDPMTGAAGLGAARDEGAGTAVYLQLEPRQSVFLRLLPQRPAGAAAWIYRQPGQRTVELNGEWSVEFLEGGPELPPPARLNRPDSWTRFAGTLGQAFAGTARYSLTFDAPPGEWWIDLGAVRESARVRLNGHEIGTLIEPPFQLPAGTLKPAANRLEVEVTNLGANRIRWMDERRIEWRVFHDINFVNIDYKRWDTSKWPVRDSGLLGPAVLREAVEIKPPAFSTDRPARPVDRAPPEARERR